MNQYDDDLTTQLTRSLSDHSDVMTGTSLGLADVKGRARSIRRRRTATAVVAVAAAVAVIVPTAALAGHTGGNPEPAPATQTTRTPSPQPTATAADDGHQPAPGLLDVADLPTGPGPSVSYVADGKLFFPDGGSGDLRTRYPADQFVEMDDGSRVWQTSHNGTPYIEIQDSDGNFHDPVRSDWSLDVNPAHTIAAWLTPTGQVIVWGARASDPRPLGDPITGSEPRLAAIIGDRCDLACSVVVNVTDAQGDSQPWEVNDRGSQELRDGGFRIVDDISAAGLTAGRTELSDSGSCTKVLGGGEFAGWKTCKNQVASFSPDGRLAIGYPAYFDGLGPSSIAVLDAVTGKTLVDRGSDEKHQALVATAAWEDDTHVLAAVFQGGTWALVRIASDGSMEYAVPPAPGEETGNPFVLPTRPLSFSG